MTLDSGLLFGATLYVVILALKRRSLT